MPRSNNSEFHLTKESLIHVISIFVPLILLVVSLEGLAHIAGAKDKRPTFIASPHRQFAAKWTLSHEMKGISCIFLGDSSAQRSIDPSRFEKSFEERAGYSSTCFNFGLSGVTASELSYLVPMIEAEFSPDLIVYGFTARSFNSSFGVGDAFADTPILSYYVGSVTPEEWLHHHARSIDYLFRFNDWFFQQSSYAETLEEYHYHADGYAPFDPGDGCTDIMAEGKYYEDWRTIEMSAEDFAGIAFLADQTDESTIVLLEIPVHTGVWDYLAGGRDYYEQVIGQPLKAYSAAHNFLYIDSSSSAIPGNGFHDSVHLNDRGASYFSEWTAAQIAEDLK